MTHTEQLVLGAIQNEIALGETPEQAQVGVLLALAKICSASGPKNLPRLVSEHHAYLSNPGGGEEFEATEGAVEFRAVPLPILTGAYSWLCIGEREERTIAQELGNYIYEERLS